MEPKKAQCQGTSDGRPCIGDGFFIKTGGRQVRCPECALHQRCLNVMAYNKANKETRQHKGCQDLDKAQALSPGFTIKQACREIQKAINFCDCKG